MVLIAVALAWCIFTPSTTAERWYDNGDRWASSPVGRALEERNRGDFNDSSRRGHWKRRIQEQLHRLKNIDAERRIRCFTAAQERATASLEHHHPAIARQGQLQKVVLVSGSTVLGSSGGLNNLVLDIALSKKAYARRHNYAFEYYSAEQFIDDLAKARLPRWEFAKTFMLRDAWVKHSNSSKAKEEEAAAGSGENIVILWSDYDVWFNPRHASLPVSAFSDEALRFSPEKIVVMGPESGLNTGFFLWRMTRVGRHMLFKWHAIVVSGAVECHGYDQAAFQMLVLQMKNNASSSSPYTCKQPACGASSSGGGALTCNHLYHLAVGDVLTKVGIDKPTGHELDNGLANDLFPLVHVLGKRSPR